MEKFKNLLLIIDELKRDAENIDAREIETLENLILQADRIFIAGAGRSGFVARAFSNRIMHLGFEVYFVGEPTTPSIRSGDLLIIGSGSGETSSLVAMAKKAKSLDVKIATLTIHSNNTIGKLADASVKIPGATSKTDDSARLDSIQPKGSSFEQLCWLVYDSLVVDLKKIKNQTQSDMDGRHANLE